MRDTTYQDQALWWSTNDTNSSWMQSSRHTVLHDTDTVVPATRTFFPGSPANGEIKPTVRTTENTDWAFLLVVALLFLVAALRFTYSKRMNSLFSAIFSRTTASQVLREYNLVNSQLFLPLFLIYMTSISLFTYIILYEHSDNVLIRTTPAWQIMILIFVAHVVYMLLKVLTINVSGWIFQTRQVTNEYIHNLFLFDFFVGIILLPMTILVLYSGLDFFFMVTLVVVFLVFISRFLRGFIIGLSNSRFSIFHLFLYLCTLEILPLAVIAKFAIKYA